jgi:hypothetical protein
VAFEQGRSNIQIIFGSGASALPEGDRVESEIVRAKFELALGEDTIRTFAKNNSGFFWKEFRHGRTILGLEFALPAEEL